jgi:hypothetical protein
MFFPAQAPTARIRGCTGGRNQPSTTPVSLTVLASTASCRLPCSVPEVLSAPSLLDVDILCMQTLALNAQERTESWTFTPTKTTVADRIPTSVYFSRSGHNRGANRSKPMPAPQHIAEATEYTSTGYVTSGRHRAGGTLAAGGDA